jgi:hypothetical protein
VEVKLHIGPTVLGIGWRLMISFRFLPPSFLVNNPVTNWIGGWVHFRAGLNVVKKGKLSVLLPESEHAYSFSTNYSRRNKLYESGNVSQ